MIDRGRTKYIPSSLVHELEDLKIEHNIKKDKVAMDKIVEYTRVGREVERIIKLDFKHKPTRFKRGLF